jgi:hypothetical protein
VPNIPTYEARQSAPNARLVPTGSAESFGGAIAQQLGETARQTQGEADELANMDFLRARARRTQALSAARVDALGKLSDLSTKYANDPDPGTVPQRWKEGRDQLLETYKTQFGGDTGLYRTFKNDFDEYALRERITVEQGATKQLGLTGRAQLDSQIDTLASMAAQTDDPARLLQIHATAKLAINDGISAGYIDPVDAGKVERSFFSKGDEAKVRQLIVNDPATAAVKLADPSQFTNLDEVKRSQLLDTATRRVDSIRSDQIRLAEKADRDADKALTKAGQTVAKNLWAQVTDHTITRDDVEAQRQVLPVDEYKALLVALNSDDAKEDDVGTLAALEAGLGQPGFAALATAAAQRREIKTSTFTSYMEKNRSLTGQDRTQQQKTLDDGRGYVRQTLDPGALLSGPSAAIARAGMVNALQEYDTWASAHPDAGRDQINAKTREIIGGYQVINYQQLSLATGLPKGFTGSRESLTEKDLAASKTRVLAELDAGTLTKDEAALELRKLKDWSAILTMRAAQQQSPGAK